MNGETIRKPHVVAREDRMADMRRDVIALGLAALLDPRDHDENDDDGDAPAAH